MSSLFHRLFAVLLVTAGAACSVTETAEPVGLRTVPRIQELQLADNNPVSRRSMAKIRLQYVELQGHHNPQVEDKINHRIRDMIGMNQQFDGSEDLSMAITRNELGKSWLTLVAEGSYYHHAALKPRQQVRSLVVNLQTGEPVTLADLFGPDYRAQFRQLAPQWFAGKPYTVNSEAVAAVECFYWDNRYLYLCFSENTVAPASEGIVTLPLSRTSIKPLLRDGSPL
ncbi:MAG TPA: hypothetical protein VIN71_03025 [Pseudomonadales bacterium]